MYFTLQNILHASSKKKYIWKRGWLAPVTFLKLVSNKKKSKERPFNSHCVYTACRSASPQASSPSPAAPRLRAPHQIKWIRLRVCLFAIDFYLQATLSPLDSISLVLHARNPYEPRPTSYSLALPSTDWASLGIASDKETCPICV